MDEIGTFQAAHNDVGPTLQFAMRIDLWRGDRQLAIDIRGHGAVCLYFAFPIGRKELDDKLFANGENDIGASTQTNKWRSGQIVHSANRMHSWKPGAYVLLKRHIICAAGDPW